MSPREQFLVERLVERLVSQPPQPVDADAQREVELLMRRRPDAPYLLLQRALQLEEALKLAYDEIEQMRRRGAQAVPDANAFGHGGATGMSARQAAAGLADAGAAAAATRGPGAGGPGAGGPGAGGIGALGRGLFDRSPGGAGPAQAQPQPQYQPAAPAGGGFLRNAGAVAAGVVGGSLLFHGIESLLHPHGSGLLGNNGPQPGGETAGDFLDAPRADAGAAGFDALPEPPAQAPIPGDGYAPDDGYVADEGYSADDAGSWDDSGGSDGGEFA